MHRTAILAGALAIAILLVLALAYGQPALRQAIMYTGFALCG